MIRSLHVDRAESWLDTMRRGFETEGCEVPEHLRHGFEMWVMHGRIPGGFMCAVIRNDLADALPRADSISRRFIPQIVTWLVNFAPGPCHGSEAAFLAWADSGGVLNGAPIQREDGRWMVGLYGIVRLLPEGAVEEHGIDGLWASLREFSDPETWAEYGDDPDV